MTTTLRCGVAFCTTHIKARDLDGISRITAVRYAPDATGKLYASNAPADWQHPGLDWSQDATTGDLILGPREPVQAVIEIDGDAG